MIIPVENSTNATRVYRKGAINDDTDNRSHPKGEKQYMIINNDNNKSDHPFHSNQYRH